MSVGVLLGVGVIVGVSVGAAVGVIVGVSVAVGVLVGVSVAVSVGVLVGVSVAVSVGVAVGVLVGVSLGVGVWVGVSLGVGVDVFVGVIVGVLGGVGVAHALATQMAPPAQQMPPHSPVLAPAGPQSKHGPVSWAAWLTHAPRADPGGKFSRHQWAQTPLEAAAASAGARRAHTMSVAEKKGMATLADRRSTGVAMELLVGSGHGHSRMRSLLSQSDSELHPYRNLGYLDAVTSPRFELYCQGSTRARGAGTSSRTRIGSATP